MKKIFIIFLIGFFVLNKYTYAYIAPGSGAMIIGAIWPLIITVFLTIIAFLAKYFWRPIKKHSSRLFRPKRGEENDDG